ncbi:Uncharacterized protein BM_BM12815 [Brugia malayi]|uniref:Bm12815 n=1 Tax=Brugia malayi TaxID=6279 RepID=A0A0I9NBS4_BRUMA|nr:Uncharacterized protein BM_BM12815 [Brugia malayi]CTP82058.1 Bm12815 [Brugia malayi]VIO96097.1 Uncharacterized protein BM_BM12815 [Brugia malayi]
MVLSIQLLWFLLFYIFGVSDEALFGISCEEHRDELSEWSQCIIPHGDLADAITLFLKSVKNFGCKLPPKKVIKFGLNFLRNNSNSYLEHPLYKRITTQNCGKCSRRIRCCKRSKSFLAQAYESEACSGSDVACVFDPLSAGDLRDLKERYPNVVPSQDGCDVSDYVTAELLTLSKGPTYQYVEPLLCQILGTRIPAVNCVLHGDKCHCCCFSYTPQSDGYCHLSSNASSLCPSHLNTM